MFAATAVGAVACAAILIALVVAAPSRQVVAAPSSSVSVPRLAISLGDTLPPGPGLARVTIPGLQPAFNPGVGDYVTTCDGGTLSATIDPTPGVAARLADGPWRRTSTSRRYTIAPGQGISFALRSPSGTRRYRVRCLPDDFPSWQFTAWHPSAWPYYAVTPYGYPVSLNVGGVPVETPGGYGILFDRWGVPVWWLQSGSSVATPGPAHHRSHNLQVMPNGHLAISEDVGTGIAIYNASGQRLGVYKTRGSPTDDHEFQPLPNGDYLLETYRMRRRPVDLSRFGGPHSAYVEDSVVQEETPGGRVVWRWNAGRHVSLSERDRGFSHKPARQALGKPLYDLQHLNSADEVSPRRLLVSLRYNDAIYEISKRTGDVIWKLGGQRTPKSLEILDDPVSTPLYAQHDARMNPGNVVTVFDNNDFKSPTGDFKSHTGDPPRAVAYQIDPVKRTATLLRQWQDPEVSSSPCCGDARLAPSGAMTVGWGNDTMTEFAPDGQIAFRLRYAEAHAYRAVPVAPGYTSGRKLQQGMDRMYGEPRPAG